MLGNDYLPRNHYYALGATSVTFSASQLSLIGSRNVSKMADYYTAYKGWGYGDTDALKLAIQNYDKDAGGTASNDLSTFLKNNPGVMQNITDWSNPTKLSNFIAVARGQGYTQEQLDKMIADAKKGNFDLNEFATENASTIIIGGVALVALLFMLGTKGRRR